jgi:hypothetical protein
MSSFESFVTDCLNRLEAKQRRLRWICAVLVLLSVIQTGVVLYVACPVGSWLGLPRTVEASRFVLVDEQGRVRGEWEVDQGPRLVLSTEDGIPRATLWVNNNGASSVMLLDNKNGAGRAAILSAYDDEAALNLLDAKTLRAALAVNKGQTGLQLFDAQGKPLPGR